MQVVILDLGKETFAIEALAVQEILRRPHAVSLPEAPPHVLGIIDFRGRSIPLIHLGRMLSVPTTAEGMRAIVLEEEGFSAAFLVDDVSDVINIPDHAFDPMPAAIEGATQVPKAVARLKDRLIVVIDPVRLLLGLRR
ncbi:MAG: Chemotaxis protein CheW [Firmicutes bacterium]|nr:Chemotaxis protein CheW [Bacillota bacterium]